MNIKKILLIITVVSTSLFIFSCSKKNDSSPASDTLIAQWSLIKIVYKDTTTNVETTEPYDQGSYLRFDNNGICYSFVDGETNASNWHYIDNNKGIFIDNSNGFNVNDSGYTITTLTTQSLVLYSKDIYMGETQTLYLQK